jgi:hypothetical protein
MNTFITNPDGNFYLNDKKIPYQVAPYGVYCGACPSFKKSCNGCGSQPKKQNGNAPTAEP